MRHTDIAIAGGGLAGSTAAAMLGRAGYDAVVIDPHKIYPFDFRCEKLDASQVRLVRKTGLAGEILPAGTTDDEVWIARFGHLVEKRPNQQYGILYDALVNTIRAAIPPGTELIHGKVAAISTSVDRQRLTLASGEEVSARLIVLANGLNIGLRHTLGMTREVVSACHSISIGFDVEPVGRPSFEFRALTYYPEHASDRMAYLTLFPVTPTTMRANLFVYRDMHDPWLRQMRDAPVDALFALMPGLRKFVGQIQVPDHVKIRPVDLYVTDGHRQAGVVLVGDAFGTSCPAAGTGCNKVFTDVERLCNVHIPRWLASDGMGEDKIAAFYDDSEKRAIHRKGLLPALAVDRRRVALAGAALGQISRARRDRDAPPSARAAAGPVAGPTGGYGRQQGLTLTMEGLRLTMNVPIPRGPMRDRGIIESLTLTHAER